MRWTVVTLKGRAQGKQVTAGVPLVLKGIASLPQQWKNTSVYKTA